MQGSLVLPRSKENLDLRMHQRERAEKYLKEKEARAPRPFVRACACACVHDRARSGRGHACAHCQRWRALIVRRCFGCTARRRRSRRPSKRPCRKSCGPARACCYDRSRHTGALPTGRCDSVGMCRGCGIAQPSTQTRGVWNMPTGAKTRQWTAVLSGSSQLQPNFNLSTEAEASRTPG